MKQSDLQKQTKLRMLESKCREKGIPLTVQRRAVLDALLERDDHPTIDQIFADVKNRMPGVSRTTVYRVLEALVDLGIARRTRDFEAAARFDGNTDHHHHLVCVRCNKIADFDGPSFDPRLLPDVRKTGFHLLDYSVYFEGVCGGCKKDQPNPRKSP